MIPYKQHLPERKETDSDFPEISYQCLGYNRAITDMEAKLPELVEAVRREEREMCVRTSSRIVRDMMEKNEFPEPIVDRIKQTLTKHHE